MLLRPLEARVEQVLRADLPEPGHLERRKISARVGAAPFARDCGKVRGPGLLRGGRASVRSVLYLAALTKARFDPVLRDLYQRLPHTGNPPKLAFVALARKLLTLLNGTAGERTAWQTQDR